MKRITLAVMIAVLGLLSSCTTVPSGHKGVEVSWGGKTNMEVVHSEGMNSGLHWLFDEVIAYDVREHTMKKKFSFNDAKDMLVNVELALDYNLSPLEVNKLHTKINDYLIKVETSLSSAAKEVVPQYTAVDLNKHKRVEAENRLNEILKVELPEFFVQFKRVRITDVDIPAAISKMATANALQLSKNKLAEKKEAEMKALAKADIATAEGKFKSAEFDVKTKELMSAPAVLALYRAETDRAWAKSGISRYGNNNIFGSNAASVIKGLK